jgi:hypothetical protein
MIVQDSAAGFETGKLVCGWECFMVVLTPQFNGRHRLIVVCPETCRIDPLDTISVNNKVQPFKANGRFIAKISARGLKQTSHRWILKGISDSLVVAA